MMMKIMSVFAGLKNRITPETWQLLGDFCLKAAASDDPNQFIRDALQKSIEVQVIREKGKLKT